MSDEPIACVVDLHLRAILLAKPRIVIELTGVFPLPLRSRAFSEFIRKYQGGSAHFGFLPERISDNTYIYVMVVGIHISSAVWLVTIFHGSSTR